MQKDVHEDGHQTEMKDNSIFECLETLEDIKNYRFGNQIDNNERAKKDHCVNEDKTSIFLIKTIWVNKKQKYILSS